MSYRHFEVLEAVQEGWLSVPQRDAVDRLLDVLDPTGVDYVTSLGPTDFTVYVPIRETEERIETGAVEVMADGSLVMADIPAELEKYIRALL